MKKTSLSFLAALLSALMIFSSSAMILSSCAKKNTAITPSVDGTTGEVSTDGSASTDGDTNTNGNGETNVDTEDPKETTTKAPSDEESTEPFIGSDIGSTYKDSIVHASNLANGVQTFYKDGSRSDYIITNQNMSLEFALRSEKKLVTAIRNLNGDSYIENTMDVFVKMSDNNVYYISDCNDNARANIYRFGYYYYDVHFLDQSLSSELDIEGEPLVLDMNAFDKSKEIKDQDEIQDTVNRKFNKKTGEFTAIIRNLSDPYIYMSSKDVFNYSADDYNAITFTVKSTSTTQLKFYYLSSEIEGGHKDAMMVPCSIVSDGEYHTYTVLLTKGADYKGTISRLRIDFEGGAIREEVTFKDVKLVKANSNCPSISLDRTFHTYSDKMHQELHFVATQDTTGIAEVGMITKVDAAKVDKVFVKDGQGYYSTIDGVDWNTAEYIGFDIQNVGIFGYILPVHENTGKMTVQLVDGYYVITQISTPKDGTILAPVEYTENDYRMGQRIYTDTNHSFDAFIVEAEIERNPAGLYFKSDKYIAYNALNGAYEFNIGGTGFNSPFRTEWNLHYSAEVALRCDNYARNVYIRTKGPTGCLENAVLLSDDDLVLPIQMEVSKNFGSEDEEPIYYYGDHVYSETVFPLSIAADQKMEFTVLNLYQNWGKFPLKQLSSIQYFAPYYHLSVGTTETSCIAPWYNDHGKNLWTLPDFRSMSAPWWWDMEGDNYSNQPQHTHGGYHYFLQYTDADGNHYASENIKNVINSSGPTYVDVQMDYISDDGKIKVTYSHYEMPHTDEHRALYEISYEVLADVSFDNFLEDFSFYSTRGYSGNYKKMGYLDETNKFVTADGYSSDVVKNIVLGDNCPYFALYDLYKADGQKHDNSVNVGFVIHSSDIMIGGEKYKGNFAVSCANDTYSLSLNLGATTLKAGDKITINMIISPWGSHLSTDDSNMRAIRENTCLDPLTVKVTNGEKINSVFVPKVRSTDGKTAEFTLSGGTNNATVHVYGFKKLTAPKIQELVEGEWVDYIVSSIDTPDKGGNKHYYDGYYAYYDKNGTISYSFCVDMTDVESRTFRISAEEDFKKWPAIPDSGDDAPLNVYVSSEGLYDITIDGIMGVGEILQLEDDGIKFIRFYGDGSNAAEATFTVYGAKDDTDVSGQYLVIKYRSASTNKEANRFEFFSSTVNASAAPRDYTTIQNVANDGIWHVAIIDLSKEIETFAANSTDEFCAKYLRLDIFNTPMSAESYIDIAYIGITDDLARACTLNDNLGVADIYSAGKKYAELDMASGFISEVGGSGNVTPEPPKETVYVDPSSGWKVSEVPYKSAIDFINGFGDGDGAYDSKGAYTGRAVDVLNFDGPTVAEGYLAIAGWTMAHGGIEKYVWSADNGKTWHEVSLYGRESIGNASSGMIDSANSIFKDPEYDAGTHKENCNYQGSGGKASGIAAKLTDYIGQEVDVTFAAVPASDPTSLCVMIHITNVRVYASDADAEIGESERIDSCTHTKPYGDYAFIDDGNSETDRVQIAYKCLCGEVTFEAKDPQYVFFFDNIIGSANTGNKFLAAENSKGYKTINASGEFTADATGKITINGWAGMNGGLTKVVYKVYNAAGEELTAGWTDPSSVNISFVGGAVAAEMTKRNIETEYARNVSGLEINLSQYLSTTEGITVKLAFVSDGAEKAGCEDKYLDFVEITNILAYNAQ